MEGSSGPVRISVMPDSFGGTLTALDAATAIAEGWRAVRPHDELLVAPQSDGGPGFLDVLQAVLGGERLVEPYPGPLTGAVDASFLLVGATAYLECAQTCGLHLLGRTPDPDTAYGAGTRGLGEQIKDALDESVRRLVIGLGGSASTDGGRGMVDALGGITAARDLLGGLSEVIVATDVDNPLLGPEGSAAVFGPQKGADPAMVKVLETRLAGWADELVAAGCPDVRATPGAGAAGGLGAALLALGARRESGAAIVGRETRRAEQIASSSLVLTGEGKIDQQTLHGKVAASVAREARLAGVPVTVIAGQSGLTPDQEQTIGQVHTLAEYAGDVATAQAHARRLLTELTGRIARDFRPRGLGE